ncbi:MAG: HipA domain-containing protein [Bacteroidetes bacterium]|nr:HipA domain-containing protein [Bacteroidota bacterium]
MICYGCFKEHEQEGYCKKCLKELFNGKKVSHILPFNSPAKEDSTLYTDLTTKMSISGVQVKYSVRLEEGGLVLTEKGGQYILKPIPVGQFKNLDQAPANEHLTMQLAKQIFKFSTPPNAIIYFQDGSPAYLVKRFDVNPDGSKIQQEDFAQIAQVTEETHGKNYKYDLSYEEIGLLIKQHIPTYKIEMEKFFRLLLFNYVFSNGDAHVKNFSAIQTDMGDYVLSPVYDLLCTCIHSPSESDTALTLFKDGFSEAYNAQGFYTHFDFLSLGKKLGIIDSRVVRIIDEFRGESSEVEDLVSRSFLKDDIKKLYSEFQLDKVKRLKMEWADGNI